MIYTVVWKIEVDTTSFESAALEAKEIQEDLESTATIFEVIPHEEFGPIHSKIIDINKL